MYSPNVEAIPVTEVAARLANVAVNVAGTEPLQLIDVREPPELAIAALSMFENLPLSEYAEWSASILERFDPDIETYVLCHHGIRSAQMCLWLQSQGFARVKNIQGGIDAWSRLVDPDLPRY